MPDVAKRSAEEFYSQCLANARTLGQAAHAYAEVADVVSTLAVAWGADVYSVQAVLWERILVASTAPQRQFFRVADALFSGMVKVTPPLMDRPTIRDVITAERDGLLAECDPALRSSIAAGWSDLSYLATVPAPGLEEIAAAAERRLEGLSPADFVARRRQESAAAMSEAQALRVRGETEAAIRGAYESDFLGLEAYLVESAVATGDVLLQSVVVRWELATAAVSQLAGLPDGFVAAVTRIRETLGASLSEADAVRMRERLIPVST